MKVLKRTLLLFTAALISANVVAQNTYEDAVNLYNEAQKQAQAKEYDAAIATYMESAEIGKALGTNQGTEIQNRSEQQIPKVQINKAGSLFNTFRSSKQISDLDNAIAAFEKTVELATTYEDDRVKQTAQGYVPQLYYQKGLLLFRQEKFQEADQALNQAIQANSNYAQPYYQKGLVAKKMNAEDIDNILNWFDQAIQVADRTNKSQISRKANEAAHDELLFRGSKAIEAKQYDRALELLNLATTYDEESADVYYRIAEALNKKSEHQRAISNANKALNFENGGKTDLAKIYFEIGFANQALGNTAEACAAFAEALYGSFKSPAQHKMEFELKCESTK